MLLELVNLHQQELPDSSQDDSKTQGRKRAVISLLSIKLVTYVPLCPIGRQLTLNSWILPIRYISFWSFLVKPGLGGLIRL
jgi:hypothetical protein